jgi:N-ethylmaleimide reductase
MLLFDRYVLGDIELSNRIVMAPMTRSRAAEKNTPNTLMAQYYGQRASAGLIVTEGVSPSPNGLGYARIPGLFNEAHVAGWKLVTDAVHSKGGKIFVQLMHTGRVSHQDNLPLGSQVVGPSSEPCPGEMWVDKTAGMHPHTTPHALSEAEIQKVIQEYISASQLAMLAGFDGVELHAANGYLMEQFLNPNVNKRTDGYGATIAGRNRFVVEVADACVKEIGANRVGIRLSPQGVFNSTGDFPELESQFLALTHNLSRLGLVYLHLVDHSAMGAPPVSSDLKKKIRVAFAGTYIAVGGFTAETAEKALERKEADLIAFGRPFISNPDLVEKLRTGSKLTDPDMSTFYTPGEKGYTDY